jgi:hypothetical protein
MAEKSYREGAIVPGIEDILERIDGNLDVALDNFERSGERAGCCTSGRLA